MPIWAYVDWLVDNGWEASLEEYEVVLSNYGNTEELDREKVLGIGYMYLDEEVYDSYTTRELWYIDTADLGDFEWGNGFNYTVGIGIFYDY